jgi:hypothetical protein
MHQLTGILLTTLALSTLAACPGVESTPPDADDEPTEVDAAAAPAEEIWDLTAAFPGTTNPSGPWTYGYRFGLDGALVEFSALALELGEASGAAWYDPANHDSSVPSVWMNSGTELIYGNPAGMVALHPGLRGEYAVVRFIAPAPGTYSAEIQFFDGDTGATDATVVVDGDTVFARAVTADNPAFTLLPVTLDAGESIEVLVGPAGDGYADTTPVSFTIHAA